MTKVTPLGGGLECIQVSMSDAENDVRLHLHLADYGEEIVGILVLSAQLGVLYRDGVAVGVDCEERS